MTHFCEIRELHNLYADHGSYYKLEIKIVIQIPCMGILAQNVDARKKWASFFENKGNGLQVKTSQKVMKNIHQVVTSNFGHIFLIFYRLHSE